MPLDTLLGRNPDNYLVMSEGAEGAGRSFMSAWNDPDYVDYPARYMPLDQENPGTLWKEMTPSEQDRDLQGVRPRAKIEYLRMMTITIRDTESVNANEWLITYQRQPGLCQECFHVPFYPCVDEGGQLRCADCIEQIEHATHVSCTPLGSGLVKQMVLGLQGKMRNGDYCSLRSYLYQKKIAY